MTQLLVTAAVLVAIVAAVGAYRLIISDGGGPRRSPLPAEPPERNTILPRPRCRGLHDGLADDVVAERRYAVERFRAQYPEGRVNT